LLIVFALSGGLSLTMYALFNAHVNDWLEPAHIVGAGSRLLLINGIGAMSGPLVASVAMSIFGPPGFFWLDRGCQWHCNDLRAVAPDQAGTGSCGSAEQVRHRARPGNLHAGGGDESRSLG
jgi:hypothetical protein